MKTKRYADALFFRHLVLEAELKALVVLKTRENAPFIHHLPKLAELAQLLPTDSQDADLKEMTAFNIDARYSDYKLSFYKKATRLFSEKYVAKTKELRIWIRKIYNQRSKEEGEGLCPLFEGCPACPGAQGISVRLICQRKGACMERYRRMYRIADLRERRQTLVSLEAASQIRHRRHSPPAHIECSIR